uniref:Regulator of G-protein signaling 21-like n=1 Tax=Phallusia mammillata TaxID=59560 RepID=A0A6F9DQ38_9ASCI|nr:regulator of G-protein signaling 21-like [Phallusia mammillata]
MHGKSDESAKSKRRLSLDFFQTKSSKTSRQKRQSSSSTKSNEETSSKSKISKQKNKKLAFVSKSSSRPRILRTQSSYVIDTVRETTSEEEMSDVSFTSDFDMSDVSFTSVFSHCPTPPPRRLSEISIKSYDHGVESSRLRRNLFTPVRKTAHRIQPVTSSSDMAKALRHAKDVDKTPTQSGLNRIHPEEKRPAEHFGKKQRRDSDIGLNTSASSSRKRRSDYFYSLPGLKNIKMTSPKTLRDFLKKKSRMVAFRSFLKKEFSEENLDFWVEVEAYRKQRQTKQIKLAPIICKTYVEVGALREVNIDAVTRKNTMCNSLRPDSTTFDLAQARVYILMERDSFQRFLLKEWNTSSEEKSIPCHKEAAKTHRKSICIEEKKQNSKSDLFLHPNITERRRKASSQL